VRTFRRELLPLLSATVRTRLRWTTVGGVVLALLDTIGVALVLPLVQFVTADADGPLPEPAATVAELMGASTRGGVAVALSLVVLVAFVSKGLAALGLLHLTTQTSARAELEMADRLIRAYLAAPITFHVRHNSARLQTTIHESLRHVYQEGLASTVPAVGDRLVIAAIGASLLLLAPLEAMAGGATMAMVGMGYRRVARRRSQASSAEMLEASRRSYQLTQQALASVREITISGTRDRFAGQLLDVRRAYTRRQALLTLTEQLPRYYLELGLVGAGAAVAAVSFAHRPVAEALPVLGLLLAGGLRVLPSLNRALNASAKVDAALPHLRHLVEDLGEAEDHREVEVDRSPLDPDQRVRRVRFRDVAFRYDDVDVLRGVDFEVAAGEVVALVGASGAGKTTAVSLLLGLLDPVHGSVDVDGTPVPACRRSWQRRIGYVPQDVVVLDGTVRENVAFGDPNPDDARVWTALALARLDDLVRGLPDGLDARPGESGARLSGGQRQRLGLARALYRGPDVLVLDEATSSLDAATEASVLQTVDAARAETMVVLVTHRLTTVRGCDRVVVLADGAVEAIGSYAELLEGSVTFAALVRAAGADAAPRPTP